MIQAVFKFVAVWFAALLLTGATVYFSSASVDALDPAIEIDRQKNCDRVASGFETDGKADCLEQVARYLESRLAETQSDLLYWHSMAGLAVLILGLIFMVQIVQRSTAAVGPADFRSMKGAWRGYLLAILAVTVIAAILAHFTNIFGQWAAAFGTGRGWGIPAFMALVWPATFWIGSRIGTPDIMKPSIPGA